MVKRTCTRLFVFVLALGLLAALAACQAPGAAPSPTPVGGTPAIPAARTAQPAAVPTGGDAPPVRTGVAPLPVQTGAPALTPKP